MHDLPDGIKMQIKSCAAIHVFNSCRQRLQIIIIEEFIMPKNQLIILSKAFAVDIVELCANIKGDKKVGVLINQLLRSGTSIGANIHEANYASSKADFINKFQISLKECYETDYWLDLFKTVEVITPEQYTDLFTKCSKIRKLLIASIRTAKGNNQ